jgi:hypothetical protein
VAGEKLKNGSEVYFVHHVKKSVVAYFKVLSSTGLEGLRKILS